MRIPRPHLLMLAFILHMLTAVAACSSGPAEDIKRIFQTRGEPQLKSGISLYKDGRYAQATTTLQSAIAAGLSDADQVTANKYLAFMSCVSKRERQCRAYFRRALELDPSFELGSAEAGHPIWGPVFRSIKARR